MVSEVTKRLVLDINQTINDVVDRLKTKESLDSFFDDETTTKLLVKFDKNQLVIKAVDYAVDPPTEVILTTEQETDIKTILDEITI